MGTSAKVEFGGEMGIVICGIAGSLRARSYNRALLKAAQELAPDGVEVRIFERLGDLPHYNSDLEVGGVAPEPVLALRQAIGEADALLLASPEYNHSIPGVLKNAIDWASRPANASVLNKKPCAIFGASTGVTGTVRGQLAIRQALMFTETHVLLKPEVLIGKAAEKFDAELRLTDEPTRGSVAKLLAALVGSIPAKP
jgi:chromate reductase